MDAIAKNLTVTEIANLCGTSKSTVSRVLNKDPNVSEKTRLKIQKIIKDVGYHPSLHASVLSGGKTRCIMAIASHMANGFFADVINGLSQMVSSRDHWLMCSFGASPKEYIDVWTNLSQQKICDGVVLIAPPREIFDVSPSMCQYPAVICACSGQNQSMDWASVSSVTVNNYAAFTELLSRIWARGIRKIAHVAGYQEVYDAKERLRAYRDFASRMKMPEQIIQVGLAFDEAYARVSSWLEVCQEIPEAFVAFNDSSAAGTLMALKNKNIKFPLVTGCDGEYIAKLLSFPTIRQNASDLGRHAGRLLLERLEWKSDKGEYFPSHQVLPMEIVGFSEISH